MLYLDMTDAKALPPDFTKTLSHESKFKCSSSNIHKYLYCWTKLIIMNSKKRDSWSKHRDDILANNLFKMSSKDMDISGTFSWTDSWKYSTKYWRVFSLFHKLPPYWRRYTGPIDVSMSCLLRLVSCRMAFLSISKSSL